MSDPSTQSVQGYGARLKTVDLAKYLNWPRRAPKSEWWQELKRRVRDYPAGEQVSWGIPFAMAEGAGLRVILVNQDSDEVTVRLKGRIDVTRVHGFPIQEWYRYLNCGYRVAVAGGTDKMGAYCALGWLRTYARLNPDRPFTYAEWAKAVRAGRTFSTSGPLIDLSVDGRDIGDTIRMSKNGGTVEARATAKCFQPLDFLEIVYNGQVVASYEPRGGGKLLEISERIQIPASGWLAARCYGLPAHGGPGSQAAHTSPLYITCGDTRAFDGPAAQHMLALVEGGIEYLNTLATAFDESSRKRMVKQFQEVRQELKGRLVVEAQHQHHTGSGSYHTHGHGSQADHHH